MAVGDWLGKATGAMDQGSKNIEKVVGGDFGLITQSVGWARFMWWGRMIIIIVIFFIIGMFIWQYWLKFNKRILIKKLKGSAVIDTYMDNGRIAVDSRGKTKISLMKTRKTCPVPSYKYTAKMGKKDFYEFYLDEKGNLYPVNDEPIINQVSNQVTSDKNINFHILEAWRLEEMKLAEDKFKKSSFLKAHMPEIMMFMAMVLGTTILYFTSKSAEASGVAQAMAIEKLAVAIQSLR